MNIGIDIRTLSFRRGGISQYTSDLLKTLTRLDRANRYYLFNFAKSPHTWDSFEGNTREIILRLPQRSIGKGMWEIVLLPYAAWKYDLHVWFSPDFSVPRFLNIPKVVAIHDLIFMNFYDPKSRYSKKLQSSVARAIKHASKIVVTSHYTLGDLCNNFELSREKVAVIHLAADERFHTIEKTHVSTVLKRYGIDFPYLLFVGEISRRKNLSGLLKAFKILKADGKILRRRLVIVGKKTTETDHVMKEVTELGISGEVFFTGYIPDEDLPFIYNGADLFVFPSLYEGFGIPPLEAMRCGTPVVASNATSIPEVVGEGALLFDPKDPIDMADKIDAVIHARVDVDDLIAKAKRQAEKFSWTLTAKQTMEIFNGLAPE